MLTINTMNRRLYRVITLSLLLILGACSDSISFSSKDGASRAVVNGDFPIAYVKRPVAAVGNPTDGVTFRPGGDLYIRDVSSPSGVEKNITGQYTLGRGDVADPEVSYDGKKLLFAMKGPDDTTWNIWEYNIEQDALTRLIRDDNFAQLGDDVDPAYLPDDRIVFSSNRQEKSQQQLAAAGIEPFAYRDEYEREAAIVLHVMAADGTDIRQISFNQSHDRNPTVLSSGEIMYSRWDHVGERNQFSIFFTNPDGTNMFILYGAHSPGNSFLHPREMQNGKVLSSLMPLSRTHEGGALVVIDVPNYSENDDPAPGVAAGGNGQIQPTLHEINFGRGLSEFGRFTTPYPLWDNTERALVAWTPSQPVAQRDPISGAEEIVEGDPVYGVYIFNFDDKTLRPIALAPAGYSITDPIAIMPRATPNIISDKTLDAALATEEMGILNVKSVYDTDDLERMGAAVLAKDETIPMIAAAANDTRSRVADLALLKDPSQTPASRRPARFIRITKAVPTPPGLVREAVGESDAEMQQILGYAEVEPDGSFKVKVPADTPLTISVLDAAGRAFTPHTNWLQVRPGETRTCNGCHSPRRGSALNVEPIAGNHPELFGASEEGSVHVHPGVSVSGFLRARDADGDNLNYFIVTPPAQGTVVVDDPATGAFTYTAREDAVLGQDFFTFKVNDGETDSNIATMIVNINEPPLATTGESMAETRFRYFPQIAVLQPDIIYEDVWGSRPNPCIIIRYTGNTDCADEALPSEDLTTAAPTNGIINYAEHIEPLWTKNRGVNSCTSCHNDNNSASSASAGLDLRSTISGLGRLNSYENLLLGRPVLDANGLPVFDEEDDGELVLRREPPLVIPGSSRASYLIEKLFETELLAEKTLTASVDHSGFLNKAEKRLLAEWIDVGAQYYNDPYNPDTNNNNIRDIREVRGAPQNLDPGVFEQSVHPILLRRCASCHQPFDSTATAAPNANFRNSSFILTGNVAGDANIVASMVNDLANPANSYLLARPGTLGVSGALIHPGIASQMQPGVTVPVLSPALPADEQVVADYLVIFKWLEAARIASGL